MGITSYQFFVATKSISYIWKKVRVEIHLFYAMHLVKSIMTIYLIVSGKISSWNQYYQDLDYPLWKYGTQFSDFRLLSKVFIPLNRGHLYGLNKNIKRGNENVRKEVLFTHPFSCSFCHLNHHHRTSNQEKAIFITWS